MAAADATDPVLLARAIAGNVEAFGRFYARHRARVIARCPAISVTRLQPRTLPRVFPERTHPHLVVGCHKPLGPWLIAIAKNVSIDHLRRVKIEGACEALDIRRDGTG